MKIGKPRPVAPLWLIYGTEGIGKTTFGASMPGVLLIDTEMSASRIDCLQSTPDDFADLYRELMRWDVEGLPDGIQTVVIDTTTGLERLMKDEVTLQFGAKDFASIGQFGAGFTALADRMSKLLDVISRLRAKGLGFLMLAHADAVSFQDPRMSEPFMRFQIRGEKKATSLLMQSCELIGFATFVDKQVKTSSGKTIGKGGRERIVHLRRCAAFDAKTRFDLPDEVPLEFSGPLADAWQSCFAKPSETEAAAIEGMRERLKGTLSKDPGKLEASVKHIDRLIKQGELSAVDGSRLKEFAADVAAKHGGSEDADGS